MTEPREPEPVVDADEAVQPEAAPNGAALVTEETPEVSPWHPVQPAEPDTVAEPPAWAAPETVAESVEPPAQPVDEFDERSQVIGSEPVFDPEPVAEPVVTPEPVVDAEPVVPSEPVFEPEPVVGPESVVEARPVAEPSADDAQTAETVALHVSEPAAEPTVVVPSAEPTVVVPPFEPTVAVPAAEPTLVIPEEPPARVGVPTESIFRPASPSQEATTIEQLSDEEAKLAAERAARRDARVAALAATAPVAVAAPEPVIVHKRTNDKFWGSLGLFLLRLVLAAIFAIRGLNILTDIPAAQELFAKTILPEPQIMAIVTGVASLLIALSLVLGLLTRLAGLGIALIAGGVLAFVMWGPWSPFVAGQPGFLGEFELLLAAVGLLLLLIGAGGWSLDRSFRAGRERDKAERAATGR